MSPLPQRGKHDLISLSSQESLPFITLSNPDSSSIPELPQSHQFCFGLSSDRANSACTTSCGHSSNTGNQTIFLLRPSPHPQPSAQAASCSRHSFLWFPTLWAQQPPATAALPSSTKATDTLPRCSALPAPQTSYPALFPAAPQAEMFQIS